MEITKDNLHQAIAALRQCAKENENSNTDTGAIRVSDLCNDVANYLESQKDAEKNLINSIWHKESENPGNRHPYPVLNPDGEMAYAYYEELCGWQFDRDFKRSTRMLWLDIEKILPKED
jgi:hypothetical protein